MGDTMQLVSSGLGDDSFGYLIALIKLKLAQSEPNRTTIKIYGSSADKDYCEEIIEVNGTSFESDCKRSRIVDFIRQCIRLQNISVRIKRNPIKLNDFDHFVLLDVFVFGVNAQEQLKKFLTNINHLQQGQDNVLNMMAHQMELRELNQQHNQANINGKGNKYNLDQQQQNILVNAQPQPQNHQLPANSGPPSHSYRAHQQQQQPQQPQTVRYGNSNPKHRELPVDVPDSFLGIPKQSPRYPPPKPNRQVSPPMPINTLTTFNNNSNQTGIIQQNQHLIQQQPHHMHQNPAMNNPMLQNTASNLLTHNSSLRSSIKLQQLEKSRNGNPQLQPAINQAFELNEDDLDLNQESVGDIRTVNNSHQNVSEHQVSINKTNNNINDIKSQMPNLCSVYNRLQRNLQNLNGEFAEVSGDAKLARLLSIYNTIILTHKKQFRIPSLTSRYTFTTTTLNANGQREPITYKVGDLLQSVIYLLKDEQNTDDIHELLSILCKHEIDGVCSAFDRIAQSFEFAKSPSSPVTLDSQDNHENQSTIEDNIKPNQPQVSKPMSNHNNNNMNVMSKNNNAHIPTTMANHDGSPMMNDFDYPGNQNHLNQLHLSQHNHMQNVHMDIENGPNSYYNGMLPMTDMDSSDGYCTKTIRIEKSSNQPLGATIKNDPNGSVIIGRIVCGGAAHQSKLLHEGDELLEVDRIPLRGKSVNEVVNILEEMDGPLTFTLISRNYLTHNSNNMIDTTSLDTRKIQEKFIIRAFFKYDAHNDHFIPCKELGLSFERGEVLYVIDRSDPKWWQARRDKDSECRLAGLIPSMNFLKQREKDQSAAKQNGIQHSSSGGPFDDNHKSGYISPPHKHNNVHGHHNNNNNQHHHHQHHNNHSSSQYEKRGNLVSLLFNCPKGSSPRRHAKKAAMLNMPLGPEEIPYYEEICLHYPDRRLKRPIILVGPKMIGQREIVAKLLQDTQRFARAISHTSKPIQEHERDGVDFHFVSRTQFEADMKAGKFIECGQYQNQYYGTSLEAMKEVVRSKKTCIHLVNTPSLFNFRQGRAGCELKPFFVFVKPNDSHPEKLRNIVSSFSPSKSNLEENIEAIIAEVQMIEAHYLPYFDLVLTVSDVERAYQELLEEIGKIENEPQWIPMFWQDGSAR